MSALLLRVLVVNRDCLLANLEASACFTMPLLTFYRRLILFAASPSVSFPKPFTRGVK